MIIDIRSVDKEVVINKGDVIVAQHIKTGKMLYYKLVEEGQGGIYRLLNLGASILMATFVSDKPLDAIGYIKIACKAEVIDIIPSSKLKLSTVSSLDL